MTLRTPVLRQATVLALASLVLVSVAASPAHADATRSAQWFLQYLSVADAQKASTGSGITVAVIDTGVDGSHQDLRGALLPGFDVVPGEAGNGWSDSDGHGTRMVGLVVAHGHENGGALGIAPGARVLPIRAAAVGDGTQD